MQKLWGGSHLCVCVFVCVPDLESDGVAGVVEVMRGPRGRWVKMISGKQPPATQTHQRHTYKRTPLTSETFLLWTGSRGQTES